MKLWLLRPVETLGLDNPWDPWYNKSFGFIVRATTPAEARAHAFEASGDETDSQQDAWTNATYSTCVELTAEGTDGLVMEDTHIA